jgi:DNA-binding transcriptional regulator LsrR (DeoR family)
MKQDPIRIEKLAAAYLAGQGKNQSDIAAVLGISQASVSRMLRDTKDKYWRERFEFIRDDVDDATLQTVLQRIGENKLADALCATVRRRSGGSRRGPILSVFSGGGRTLKIEERMAEFARNAAPCVQRILVRAGTCGLTWGGMLWQLINALRSLQMRAPWTNKNIDCVPLTGEPLGSTPTSFSSSSLATDLGRAANGDGYHARSIAMVPAFIPEGFTAAQLRGVWKLIGLVPSYKEIFGARGLSRGGKMQRISEHLDMILTSVGPANQVFGFGSSRLFETGRVSIERLQSLILGEMGGVCFPRPDLTAAEKRELRSVEVRWTGLNRATLEACSLGAAADPAKPGVVVVCGGAPRAQFVYEALDVINHLVIDEVLAAELGRIMGV